MFREPPFGGPGYGPPPPPPPRRRGCCGPGLCCLPLLLFGFCIAGAAKVRHILRDRAR